MTIDCKKAHSRDEIYFGTCYTARGAAGEPRSRPPQPRFRRTASTHYRYRRNPHSNSISAEENGKGKNIVNTVCYVHQKEWVARTENLNIPYWL